MIICGAEPLGGEARHSVASDITHIYLSPAPPAEARSLANTPLSRPSRYRYSNAGLLSVLPQGQLPFAPFRLFHKSAWIRGKIEGMTSIRILSEGLLQFNLALSQRPANDICISRQKYYPNKKEIRHYACHNSIVLAASWTLLTKRWQVGSQLLFLPTSLNLCESCWISTRSPGKAVLLNAFHADLDVHRPLTSADSHTGRSRPESVPIIYLSLHAESIQLQPRQAPDSSLFAKRQIIRGENSGALRSADNVVQIVSQAAEWTKCRLYFLSLFMDCLLDIWFWFYGVLTSYARLGQKINVTTYCFFVFYRLRTGVSSLVWGGKGGY